jgi:hypothetical protein
MNLCQTNQTYNGDNYSSQWEKPQVPNPYLQTTGYCYWSSTFMWIHLETPAQRIWQYNSLHITGFTSKLQVPTKKHSMLTQYHASLDVYRYSVWLQYTDSTSPFHSTYNNVFCPHTRLINPIARLNENTMLDTMMRVLMNLHTTEPKEALFGPLRLTSSCHSSSSLQWHKRII